MRKVQRNSNTRLLQISGPGVEFISTAIIMNIMIVMTIIVLMIVLMMMVVVIRVG